MHMLKHSLMLVIMYVNIWQRKESCVDDKADPLLAPCSPYSSEEGPV